MAKYSHCTAHTAATKSNFPDSPHSAPFYAIMESLTLTTDLALLYSFDAQKRLKIAINEQFAKM